MDIPLSLSEPATANEPARAPDDIIDKLAAGDPSALARCITLMESGGPTAGSIHRRVCAKAGRAAVIGFTGAPGAGKSTLIDAYIRRAARPREQRRRCRRRPIKSDIRRRHPR